MTRKPIFAALCAASLLSLAACGEDTSGEAEAGEDVSQQTVAALLDDADGVDIVTDVMGSSGLQAVFDGNAAYTVFAPTDAAFEEFDIPVEGEETRAARIAILREHIVPGYLSRDDIVAAIGRSGGSVEMETMGSNTLTFSGDADELTVTSSDGSSATLTGQALSGVNGAVFPIDGVLKSLDAPG